jgi:hypothetical protein
LLVNNFITKLEIAAKPRRKNESDDETKNRMLATLNVVNDFVGTLTNKTSQSGEYDIVEESDASGLIRRLITAICDRHSSIDPIIKKGKLGGKGVLPAYIKERNRMARVLYDDCMEEMPKDLKHKKAESCKIVAKMLGVTKEQVNYWVSNSQKRKKAK